MAATQPLLITDFAFFDDVHRKADGSLVFGNRIEPDDPNIDQLFACFVVAGESGTYSLSIKVWSEGMQMDRAPLSFKPRDVNIASGAVSARVIIPLPIKKLPVGHYVFSIRQDAAELGRFGFDIHKPR